jgi:hypothetical protein
MLRVIRFATQQNLNETDARKALEIARSAADVASQVRGITSCSFYPSGEVLQFSAESEEYTAFEKALKNPVVRSVFGRLANEFGYCLCDEELILETRPSTVLRHAV